MVFIKVKMPRARCDYWDKIQDTVQFVASQAGAKCSWVRFKCTGPYNSGGEITAACADRGDARKFRRALSREAKLLKRHRIAGRRR